MKRMWALATKDLRLLARDRVAFFFTLIFPIVYAVVFGLIFGGGSGDSSRKLTLGVVDTAQTADSEALIEALNEVDALVVTSFPTEDAARAKVRAGKLAAGLVIPEGFTTDIQALFGGQGPALRLHLDPSRQAESGMLEGLLTQAGFKLAFGSFSDPAALEEQLDRSLEQIKQNSGWGPLRIALFERFFASLKSLSSGVADLNAEGAAEGGDGGLDAGGMRPLRFERIAASREKKGPRPFEITFPQGIIWAILSSAFGFALGLVQERSQGTLIRLIASPLRPVDILHGKALACFVANAAITSLLMILALTAFDVRLGSPLKLLVSVASVSFAFVGVMMLIAVLSKTEQAASGLGWGVMMIMAMLGGGMVPLFFMPSFMQQIGVISPVRWSILALEGATWRGLGWSEIALPIGVLIGIGLAGFLLGRHLFQRRYA